MKRGYRAGIMFGMILLFNIGLFRNVRAEVFTEEVSLTEEDRYDPRYYKPVGDNSEDTVTLRSRAKSARDSFEDQIVAALLNLETSIDVSEYQLSSEEFKTAYFQILNAHAELFFVKAEYSSSLGDGKVIRFQPAYSMTDKQVIQESLILIENAANEAVSLVTEGMEDYEKALVVHDWLARYCEYDYDRLNSGSLPDVSHTAYGAFVNKMAVCDGYAKAYTYIMQQKLGITCGIVSSDSMNHAWNMVQIGSNYYHVDVTWDDPVRDCIGRAGHTYFMLSDNTIQTETKTRKPHTGWESSVKAEDTSYEDGHWLRTNSGIIYYNGTWYFTDSSEMKIKKTDNILDGTAETCYSFDKWNTANGGYYTESFSYLWQYRNKLIFNGPQAIYSMPFSTGEAEAVYSPDGLSAGTNIYGFKLEGDTLKYAVQTTPNITQAQTGFIQTAQLPGENITGKIVIDGTLRYGSTLTARVTSETELTGTASYQWYSGGQLLVGETSESYQLSASDIGKSITVKVIYDDYIGELEQSTTEIQKGIPAQPSEISGLNGNYGETLSTVSLPEGYEWKNPNTVMEQSGSQSYTVVYTPDAALYETIEFELSVEVSDKSDCTNHVWNQGVQTTAPSCTENGVITYTCQNCNATKTEGVPATGHVHTEKRNEKAATCIEAGYSGDTYCNDCETVIETGEAIPATGEHMWNEGDITEEATCTKAGEKEVTCTVCGETTAIEIPATGHVHTEKRDEKAANCKEAGYSGDLYCTDCGVKLKTGTVISATGKHTWNAGRIKTAAACTRNGIKEFACSICGSVKTETIPATGHLHTEVRNKRNATVTETGYTGDTYCKDCGTKLSSGKEIAVTVRAPKKGTILKSGKLYYQVTKSGTKNGTVAFYKVSGTVKKLTIPATVTIDGITYKVTSIAAKALKNNKKITQAVLGSNLTAIGKEAFQGCKNLKKITIKSSKVKSIGKNAMKNIHKKAVIKCPAGKVNAYKKLFTAKSGYQKKTMKITK